jgi:DNA-binding MarR family transcriptional regulator
MKTMNGDDQAGSPDDVDVVLRASRALVGVAARSLAPVEDVVTAMQWRLLVVVSGHGQAASHEVAASLGVHPSTATRLCDRLVEQGLLSRQDNPEDRRYLTLTLTSQGKRLVKRVTATRRADIQQILDRLSGPSRRRLVSGLLDFATAAGEMEVDPVWDLALEPNPGLPR